MKYSMSQISEAWIEAERQIKEEFPNGNLKGIMRDELRRIGRKEKREKKKKKKKNIFNCKHELQIQNSRVDKCVKCGRTFFNAP